jgi:hypothetical protein
MICNVNAELAFFRGKTFQGAYGRTHATRSRAKTPEQRARRVDHADNRLISPATFSIHCCRDRCPE